MHSNQLMNFISLSLLGFLVLFTKLSGLTVLKEPIKMHRNFLLPTTLFSLIYINCRV